MARITVEDCLENVENRFELVMLASERARHLALSGEAPKLPWENDKSTVMALREIAEGAVDAETIKTQGLMDEDEDLHAQALISDAEVNAEVNPGALDDTTANELEAMLAASLMSETTLEVEGAAAQESDANDAADETQADETY